MDYGSSRISWCFILNFHFQRMWWISFSFFMINLVVVSCLCHLTDFTWSDHFVPKYVYGWLFCSSWREARLAHWACIHWILEWTAEIFEGLKLWAWYPSTKIPLWHDCRLESKKEIFSCQKILEVTAWFSQTVSDMSAKKLKWTILRSYDHLENIFWKKWRFSAWDSNTIFLVNSLATKMLWHPDLEIPIENISRE